MSHWSFRLSSSVRRSAIFATAVAAVSLAGWANAAPVQWSSNGHYYDAITVVGGINWPDANALASSSSYLGFTGHLATPSTAAENTFIGDNLAVGNYLLGGTQSPAGVEPTEGWSWITGEPWIYTNWNAGEPNDKGGADDYLHYFDGPVWNDIPATYLAGGYIVEFEQATPEPAAIGALGFVLLAVTRRVRPLRNHRT